MISELQKSINSILYERVSSPFFGTLILSWLAWNWKIVYLTFFVSEKNLNETKIEFIVNNYSDFDFLFTYPLVSTAILLTIIPFFSNGAYWLHLKFYKWRSDKKHKIEMSQLLTLEQSIQIRKELTESKAVFEKLLSSKNTEIEQLKTQLEEFKHTVSAAQAKAANEEEGKLPTTPSTEISDEIAEKVINNSLLDIAFGKVSEYVQSGWSGLSENIDAHALGYFISNDIIQEKGGGVFEFTDLGRNVYKKILDNRFNF